MVVPHGASLDRAALVTAFAALTPCDMVCLHMSIQSVAERIPEYGWAYENGDVFCARCSYRETSAFLVTEKGVGRRGVGIVLFKSERDHQLETRHAGGVDELAEALQRQVCEEGIAGF